MPTICWHLGHFQRSKPYAELSSSMREPHLSQTSRCRVGVAVPLSSVPMVVVSLLLPVHAGTPPQDGLTQPTLHPFAGNFRIPIWYPPARPGRLPGRAPTVCFLDTLGRPTAIKAASSSLVSIGTPVGSAVVPPSLPRGRDGASGPDLRCGA